MPAIGNIAFVLPVRGWRTRMTNASLQYKQHEEAKAASVEKFGLGRQRRGNHEIVFHAISSIQEEKKKVDFE